MPKNDQKGFTIIELMLVLAVAGMITLIVMQAVPTLQRNARNSARKQDVAAILEAVSRYQLNNSGAMPGPCGGTADANECDDTGQVLANVRLTVYQELAAGSDSTVSIKPLSAGQSASNPNGINKVAVFNYQRCMANGSGESTFAAAGFRDIVALYAVENGNNAPTQQCQQL